MTLEGLVGNKIKLARESRGMTLDDVHHRLKIHKDILQRIEENRFDSWPGGNVYAKGFIKQYAQFLGLNTAEILSEYDMLRVPGQEVQLTIHTTSGEKQNEVKKATNQLISFLQKNSKIIIKITIILLIAILAIWLTIGTVKTIGGWIKKVTTSSSAKTTSENRPIQQEASQARTQPVQTQPVVRVEQKKEEPKQENADLLRIRQQKAREYLNFPEANNYPNIANDEPLMIKVFATTDVWMKVTSDKKVLFESILKAGEKERWIADNSLELKLGRPEGVELTLNGFLLGKPGNGQARHVVLTREGMKQL